MIKTTYEKQKNNPNRRNFAKIGGTFSLPNLIEIQTSSFDWFLKTGLNEVFNDIFPIDNGKGLSLEFINCFFEEPKYSEIDCKNRDMDFSRPLRAELRLNNNQTGEVQVNKVYMGDFPMMTDTGTFIIHGAERVIVSQIVRSAGSYFSKRVDTKNGKLLYGGDLIPSRGTWLQFETDAKDTIITRIDKNRKVYASVLLRALGLETKEDIEQLFGKNALIDNTIEKDKTDKDNDNINFTRKALIEIHSKLRPGEPITEHGPTTLMIQRFFDGKRYDLGAAGRFKLKQKLGVYNRLIETWIAEDLIDCNGEVIYKKGTFMSKDKVTALQNMKFFENGAHKYTVKVNKDFGDYDTVNIVYVYADEEHKRKVKIIGTDLTIDVKHVTIPDIYACFSYLLTLMNNVGDTDDIDHLGNRRIRSIGELLQNQFRIGLSRMERSVKERMSITQTDNMTPTNLINTRPLTSAIKEFFSSSQLSQFMDQTNPLAELTNKRRISALGQGGITRERATFDVRDVHYSHYGRICPIETPEGPNIGLINYIACYAKINQYGFIETPYRKVKHENGKNIVCDTDVVYLSADEEKDYIIGSATFKLNRETGEILDEKVVSRFHGEDIEAFAKDIDFVDVAPRQVISIPTGLIPFIENDDCARAMLGANMQRQAVPLLRPQAPFVGTGMEYPCAHDSGVVVLCKEDGVVTYVDSSKIFVKNAAGETRTYNLIKFARSNAGTCFNQTPIVLVGQEVKVGDILADGPSMDNGELALGQNVIIAFTTWHGYNYEDAVIISERLVKDDVYTSIHIEEYDLECRDTKLGPEEITRDIPNVSEESKSQLDDLGIVIPGSEVKEGDILVGKITPRGMTEPSSEEKLLMAIFGDKTKEGKDSSLRVPHGGAGIVVDVKIFNQKTGGVELSPGVNQIVRVFIAQKRKISEGDKMAGRHGNKGVISKIVPVEDMPFLPDGTPVDIILNPLGVPSRMNIGQVLELHLGMACKKLGGLKIATNPFDGVTNDELMELMAKAEMAKDGKYVLVDGQTGERFSERISVGIMYFLKLSHMVDDKLHARSIGPYSLVTQQPLGGKAQNGGQRFGEMEVWALEAYGAAHTLQEILTIKSDDVIGRGKAYEAIIKGKEIPNPGIPESFRVLQKELQALSIDVGLFDTNNQLMDTSDIMKETRNTPKYIREEFEDNNNIETSINDDISFIHNDGGDY
ncbi:MAG: DNA-directed RNA polymerase subunit beta [Erysipelotrichaceae bacterium]|nr:DNA-directed RNA polymerase subunit beta [Erysipelotrichaceae bacterium]